MNDNKPVTETKELKIGIGNIVKGSCIDGTTFKGEIIGSGTKISTKHKPQKLFLYFKIKQSKYPHDVIYVWVDHIIDMKICVISNSKEQWVESEFWKTWTGQVE